MICLSLVFEFSFAILDFNAGFECGVAHLCFSRVLALFSQLAVLGVKAKGLKFLENLPLIFLLSWRSILALPFCIARLEKTKKEGDSVH